MKIYCNIFYYILYGVNYSILNSCIFDCGICNNVICDEAILFNQRKMINMSKQQLTYQEVLIIAKGYFDLALEEYSIESYPLLLPNQKLLITAARLLRSVEKQGYNDYLWCGLLGEILFYVQYCNDAAYLLIERSLCISPHFPKELMDKK